MLTYPDIDPVAISIGPLAIHWYGLMYLVGFVGAWGLGRWRARDPARRWNPADVDDVIFYAAIGVIVGGRMGYVLFYGFAGFLENPLQILALWEGGMSFHGGLLGVLVAMWLFGRGRGKSFFEVTDYIAPLVPIGLGAGRIGNFINGELWGKPTDAAIGMVFPDPRAGGVPRHPSQLYEAALEGLALFVLLWLYSHRPRPVMAVSGMFLLCYGLFRSAVEFVRIPDAQYGYFAFDWLTMGQILSLPMIVGGAALLVLAHRRRDGGDTPAHEPRGRDARRNERHPRNGRGGRGGKGRKTTAGRTIS